MGHSQRKRAKQRQQHETGSECPGGARATAVNTSLTLPAAAPVGIFSLERDYGWVLEDFWDSEPKGSDEIQQLFLAGIQQHQEETSPAGDDDSAGSSAREQHDDNDKGEERKNSSAPSAARTSTTTTVRRTCIPPLDAVLFILSQFGIGGEDVSLTIAMARLLSLPEPCNTLQYSIVKNNANGGYCCVGRGVAFSSSSRLRSGMDSIWRAATCSGHINRAVSSQNLGEDVRHPSFCSKHVAKHGQQELAAVALVGHLPLLAHLSQHSRGMRLFPVSEVADDDDDSKPNKIDVRGSTCSLLPAAGTGIAPVIMGALAGGHIHILRWLFSHVRLALDSEDATDAWNSSKLQGTFVLKEPLSFPLCLAVRAKSPSLVSYCLELGMTWPLDPQGLLNTQVSSSVPVVLQQESPLWTAAASDDPRTLELLLASGMFCLDTEPGSRGSVTGTARTNTHCAALIPAMLAPKHYWSLTRMLLEAGANPSVSFSSAENRSVWDVLIHTAAPRERLQYWFDNTTHDTHAVHLCRWSSLVGGALNYARATELSQEYSEKNIGSADGMCISIDALKERAVVAACHYMNDLLWSFPMLPSLDGTDMYGSTIVEEVVKERHNLSKSPSLESQVLNHVRRSLLTRWLAHELPPNLPRPPNVELVRQVVGYATLTTAAEDLDILRSLATLLPRLHQDGTKPTSSSSTGHKKGSHRKQKDRVDPLTQSAKAALINTLDENGQCPLVLCAHCPPLLSALINEFSADLSLWPDLEQYRSTAAIPSPYDSRDRFCGFLLADDEEAKEKIRRRYANSCTVPDSNSCVGRLAMVVAQQCFDSSYQRLRAQKQKPLWEELLSIVLSLGDGSCLSYCNSTSRKDVWAIIADNCLGYPFSGSLNPMLTFFRIYEQRRGVRQFCRFAETGTGTPSSSKGILMGITERLLFFHENLKEKKVLCGLLCDLISRVGVSLLSVTNHYEESIVHKLLGSTRFLHVLPNGDDDDEDVDEKNHVVGDDEEAARPEKKLLETLLTCATTAAALQSSDIFGHTPLLEYCWRIKVPSRRALKRLLASGADITARAGGGKSALRIALHPGPLGHRGRTAEQYQEVLRVFEDILPPECDTVIDDVDDQGNTFLHTAAIHNDLVLVKVLLAEGVDPTTTNVEGKTPAQLAEDEAVLHALANAEMAMNISKRE